MLEKQRLDHAYSPRYCHHLNRFAQNHEIDEKSTFSGVFPPLVDAIAAYYCTRVTDVAWFDYLTLAQTGQNQISHGTRHTHWPQNDGSQRLIDSATVEGELNLLLRSSREPLATNRTEIRGDETYQGGV